MRQKRDPPCSTALFGAPSPQEKACMDPHPTLRPARLTQKMEKTMKAIQIAVKQILTFSVPHIMEKGLQFVVLCSNRGGRPTFLPVPLGVVPSLQEYLCFYQVLAKWEYAPGLGHCLLHSGLLHVSRSDGDTSIFHSIKAPLPSGYVPSPRARARTLPLHWLMFRSTLAVSAVGLVATSDAGTMCTQPCVWSSIVGVAPRVRPCAVRLTCLCSSFLHASRFCLSCSSPR